MLTFFTTGKPFREHGAVIQRNALRSWKLLHPDVEVILFGDDEGAEESARDLELRYEPRVERSETGAKRLDCFFDRAQEMARHDVVCYANCDIILLDDFLAGVEQVKKKFANFLMVGRRWDTDITRPLDFSNPTWRESISKLSQRANRQRPAQWIDYFVFPRGLYLGRIPPFLIGRVHWDNWLIWQALQRGATVVDASSAVHAIHQNHDYSYHPQGKVGVFDGEEAGRNYRLAGGWKHLRTIADARMVFTREGLRRNWMWPMSTVKRHLRQAGRVLWYDVWHPIWFALLDISRPFRNAVGLRARAAAKERR